MYVCKYVYVPIYPCLYVCPPTSSLSPFHPSITDPIHVLALLCIALHCFACLFLSSVSRRISGVCYVSLVHLGYISDQGGVLFGGGAPLPLPGGPPKDNTNTNPLPDSSSSSSLSSSSSSSSSSSDSFYAPVAKRDPFAPPPTYRPSMALAHHATMVPSLGNSGRLGSIYRYLLLSTPISSYLPTT